MARQRVYNSDFHERTGWAPGGGAGGSIDPRFFYSVPELWFLGLIYFTAVTLGSWPALFRPLLGGWLVGESHREGEDGRSRSLPAPFPRGRSFVFCVYYIVCTYV